jgi:DNA-binding transcriptional LysR family regulator
LLERTRELLALNDEIWGKFRTPEVHGTVRLGTPDDYALRYLPQVLKRFADTHPAVEVEVFCAPSETVVERLVAGELDLTLCSEGQEPRNWPAERLWRGPLHWVTSARYAPHRVDPLPLAIATDGCAWGRAARQSLDMAGRRWRVAYTSASMTGSFTPVLAGLAVTVSANTVLPEGLRMMRADEGMPELPDTGILLLQGRAPHQKVTEVLAAHIAETFGREIRRQDHRN